MRLFNTGIDLNLPPAHLFKFPPEPNPPALPPPPAEPWTLKSPFPIDPQTYNDALDVRVPVTFAVGYFIFVTFFNQVNRKRHWKPWGVSKSTLFEDFSLIHNTLLAVYSAVTCVAMVRALWVSMPGWLNSEHPFVGQVDALCKMQGPRGFGDAVSYDPASMKWKVQNSLIHLAPNGFTPDPTDVGRIWNEGLAFWGWTFYLSKFYEVVDTMIILAKGKRATTLQTFHHFGAMFAMWAGMRYMSAPIWMFVLVNSFIHSLMYTFYNCAILKIHVPPRIKRTITTMQIMQFLVGVIFASIHLFISYEVPASAPYTAAKIISNTTVAAAAATNIWTKGVELGRSSGPISPWAKQLLYRAVGAEGLAESVRDSSIYTDRAAHNRSGLTSEQSQSGSTSDHPFGASTFNETIRCIDTTGQTFAIWLNLAYLTPLMVLFIRFFVKSYITRTQTSRPKTPESKRIEQRRFSEHIDEAARRTSDVLESLGTQAEGATDEAAEEAEKNMEDAGVKVEEAKNSDLAKTLEAKAGEVKDAINRTAAQADKKLKDSSLGDSYVQVKEKMREGAAQVTGGKGSGEVIEEDEEAAKETAAAGVPIKKKATTEWETKASTNPAHKPDHLSSGDNGKQRTKSPNKRRG